MKIVFVITGLSTGGAEMMLLKLLERIDRLRFSPHIISLTSLGDLGPRIQALGFPVEAIGMKAGKFSLITFLRLARRFKVLNPDMVHTWMYHADLLGGLAAWIARVPRVVWGIRNGNVAPEKTKASTRVVVRVCALLSQWIPDRILCCSEVALQTHVALGYVTGKMIVLPNGFDLAMFQPQPEAKLSVRKELGLASDAPLVGMIGRFDPQKNHEGFIEAAALLHERLPEAHFVLAGQKVDESNKTLVNIIHAAGIAPNVHLLGLRSDIPRLMAALDVLVSASFGESFPNVLGEAMACGVPCVVTDVGGSAHIVGDTGKVVKPGDMSALAIAIEALLMLPLLERAELGKSARTRVAEHFEIGVVVSRYEAFYQSLAETDPAQPTREMDRS